MTTQHSQHSQHWDDARKLGGAPNEYTRTIGRHRNHWAPSLGKGNGRDPGDRTEWLQSTRGVSSRGPTDAPGFLAGSPATLKSLNSGLQMLFRGPDPGNRGLYAVQRSDMPDVGVEFTALDCNDTGEPELSDGDTVVTHRDLWDAVDVRLTDGGHKLKEDLILDPARKTEWPTKFAWAIKVAPGCTSEIVNNRLLIRDSDGVVRIETRAPIGWDSATTAPTIDGRQAIRCTFEFGADRFGLRTVVLTPSPDDIANAIGEVTLDPTLEVRGTSDIDDTALHGSVPNSNFGASSILYCDASPVNSALVRLSDSSLPVGTYTSVLMIFDAQTSFTAYFARLLPGEAGWAEGTVNNVAEAGSPCWNWKAYPATPWASGVAGYPGASGSDVVSHALSSVVTNTVAMSLVVFQGWESGSFVNAGLIITTLDTSGTWILSTENASPLYFIIDYDEPVSGGRSHLIGSGIGRGIARGIG